MTENNSNISKASNLSGWIPQAFYDLIGRIIPGAILLMLGFLLVNSGHFGKLSNNSIPSSLLLITGLILSYLIGIFLGAIGYMIVDKEWKIKVSELKVELPTANKPNSGISYMYDAIQHYDPAAGSRLAKLSAEKNMCRVLILGFFVLILMHAFVNWTEQDNGNFWSITTLFLLVIILVWLFYRHVSIRSRKLMLNLWHLIESRKEATAATLSP